MGNILNLEPSVLIDSNRGIYVPRYFAQMALDNPETVVGFEDFREHFNYLVVLGVEGDAYWDTWDYILNNVQLYDENRTQATWYLNQYEDLWIVPIGFNWDDPQNENYRFLIEG